MAESCTGPDASGAGACLRPIPASTDVFPARGRTSPQAGGVAPPQWCEDARGRILGTREAVCWVSGLSYETYRTVQGQRQTTGKADLNVINYSYSDSGLATWGYQIDTAAYRGWGDAMKATVSGKATHSGACKVAESKFPAKKLAPLNSWKKGEAFFDTTATRTGAIGRCATTWTLTFTNAPYTPATTPFKLNEFRCDNAVSGRRIGCVVPWYASPLIYSKRAAPQLASHITRAQNSGLPGATFARPLTRTTVQATIDTNRRRACPPRETRPSGKSCDEYPLASSNQGMASGGERRTFSGCSIRGVPSRTGPKGASACMIAESNQDYQGGKNSGFFSSERVLNGDPFRVLIGSY
ncbi:NucA/NucB deoxyribonuclease domain-containing protein [Streptomyces sp. NPDC002073]